MLFSLTLFSCYGKVKPFLFLLLSHSLIVCSEFLPFALCLSSAIASYNWLQAHGFEKYAFQFVRYNIPFYALPLVNFFIVGEMAVLGDNEVVLKALRELQDSPAYSVKGKKKKKDRL